MNKDQLEARIAELEQERQRFIEQAQIEVQRRLGEFDGRIAELRRLMENGET